MRCIFLDIDTQNDFIYPGGGLYVPGADKLVDTYDKIAVYALDNEITVLASADAHKSDDPEFTQFAPHCVRGTEGQKKIEQTLPHLFLVQPNDGKKVKSDDLNQSNVLFEKQTFDVFSNPKIDSYLQYLKPSKVVVYVVATDYCVKAAVEGLLERNYPVILLSDAIRAVNPETEKAILDDFSAKGVDISSFDQLLLSRD